MYFWCLIQTIAITMKAMIKQWLNSNNIVLKTKHELFKVLQSPVLSSRKLKHLMKRYLLYYERHSISVKSKFSLFKEIKTHMLALNIKSALGNKLFRYVNSLFEKFRVLIFEIYSLAYNILWKFYNKRASNIQNIQNDKKH